MKSLINRAFGYTLLALAAGVFYREFTKWNGFTSRTTLAFVHPHLFVLGALLMLLVALLSRHMPLMEQRSYRLFLTLHTVGLPMAALLMLVRGVVQVLATPLSAGLNAAIPGVAGLSHMVLGTALVVLFVAMKKALGSVETP